MTAPHLSAVFNHRLPEDSTAKHRKASWNALSVYHTHPYIIICDTFGGAAYVWSIESDDRLLRLITALHPPLPARLARVLAIHSAQRRVIVAGFQHPERSCAVIRSYSLDTGEELRGIELPWEYLANIHITSSDLIVAEIVSADWPHQVLHCITYSLAEYGLVEVERVSRDPVSGLRNLGVLLLTSDGNLITSSASTTSSVISLNLRGAQNLQMSLSSSAPYDFVLATKAISISPTSIAVVIAKSHVGWENMDSLRSVHSISLYPMSTQWQTPISHVTDSLSHQSALGSIVILGWESGADVFCLTFLNEHTGEIVKAERFMVPIRYEMHTLRCTSDDFVAVFSNGGLFISPLETILRQGLPRDGDDRLVVDIEPPVRPEPYNKKAERKGGMWRWVDLVIFSPRRLILFALRGPDIFAVGW